MAMHAFFLALALIFSNFLFQAMKNKQWKVAIERSFFQIVALILFVVTFKG